jgi:hypothetical protein
MKPKSALFVQPLEASMLSALIAAAVLMQAAPAAAPSTPAAAPTPGGNTVSPVTVSPDKPVSKKREADLQQVVCTSELPIGSRFPVKTCATRAERRERAQDDQMETRRWTALRPGSGN